MSVPLVNASETHHLYAQNAVSSVSSSAPEKVPLTVFTYEEFERADSHTIEALKKALLEQGIVGIRGIPSFQEKVRLFIEEARRFSALPEGIKERYAPSPDGFIGFGGKEKFQRRDGSWVVDDSKISYYGYVPEHPANKWPEDFKLRNAFQDMGALMAKMGEAVMAKIGLLDSDNSVPLAKNQVGRILHYCNAESQKDNPYWAGDHYDHGTLTALLTAAYFENGQQIAEPENAGLFVRGAEDTVFKKVVADDPDLMLFQVGEYGQLATNDKIRATEHRVQKAVGSIERHTMALFFAAPRESEISSTSVLTKDARFGTGKTCTYGRWHDESMKRYKA